MRTAYYKVIAVANNPTDPNEAVKRIEFIVRAMDMLRAVQIAQEILDNAAVINVSVYSSTEIEIP